jgi:hypothetical protein
VGAGAVIYAAHKGADTFKEWRKQKHHERCMAVAEDVLTLAYKLKRAFEGIRSPAIFAGEMSEVVRKLKDTGMIPEDATDANMSLTTAQAALSRVESNRHLFDALLEKIPVAKAIFGDDVANAMDVFWAQRAKVVSAAQSYARDQEPLPTGTKVWQRHLERRGRLEGILWSVGGADEVDDFAADLDNATARLEAALLPIIRNKAG